MNCYVYAEKIFYSLFTHTHTFIYYLVYQQQHEENFLQENENSFEVHSKKVLKAKCGRFSTHQQQSYRHDRRRFEMRALQQKLHTDIDLRNNFNREFSLSLDTIIIYDSPVDASVTFSKTT
jgi:hypothetical protein